MINNILRTLLNEFEVFNDRTGLDAPKFDIPKPKTSLVKPMKIRKQQKSYGIRRGFQKVERTSGREGKKRDGSK